MPEVILSDYFYGEEFCRLMPTLVEKSTGHRIQGLGLRPWIIVFGYFADFFPETDMVISF